MTDATSLSFSRLDIARFYTKALLWTIAIVLAVYYLVTIDTSFIFETMQSFRSSAWFLPVALLVYAFRPFSIIIPSMAVNVLVLSIVDDLGYAVLLIYAGSILATITGYWGLYAIRILWVILFGANQSKQKSRRDSYGGHLWSNYAPSWLQHIWTLFGRTVQWLMNRMQTHPVSSIIGLRLLQIPLEYPSYVAGYKQIEFSKFFIATAIGIIPGIVILCYGLSELLALMA